MYRECVNVKQQLPLVLTVNDYYDIVTCYQIFTHSLPVYYNIMRYPWNLTICLVLYIYIMYYTFHCSLGLIGFNNVVYILCFTLVKPTCEVNRARLYHRMRASFFLHISLPMSFRQR